MTSEIGRKPQVAIMNAVHDLPVLVARDKGSVVSWDQTQKESPKPTVTLTSSLEKPTSARKTAVRSKLTRSPTP